MKPYVYVSPRKWGWPNPRNDFKSNFFNNYTTILLVYFVISDKVLKSVKIQYNTVVLYHIYTFKII